MERRAFIKSSCNGCLLAASGLLLSRLAASCSPAFPVFKTEVINGEIQLPLTALGSSGFQIVRPKGWYYDIAVRKKEDASYEALLLKCTHQDNQLTPSGSGYGCTLHGSQFDKDGRVTKGPAEHPLQSYTTTLTRDQLIINIKA
ncbi:MAG: Rieske (2Fe-2S) protein [Puia sp.]|nr:Rieske (2Fe-2S) protein [Puia sp.]